MFWFFIALAGTILWSIGNFVDKLLSDRFTGHLGGVLALALFSSFFSALVALGIFFVDPATIIATPHHALVLIIAGIVEVIGIYLYLRALRHEDTSTVVPFFQSVPIFSFVLGFIILGEVLSLTQMLAGLAVIIGGVLLALDISADRHVRFKASLALLMTISAFCFALFDTLFKYGAVGEGFWTGIFWQHVGIFLAGVVVFIVNDHARRGFLMSFTESRYHVLSLNFINEVFYVGGVMLFSYALLLAPIALVATVNVFQPVFVFVFGALFTFLFPHLIKENVSLRHMLQKSLAISVIVIASVFLVS